MKILPWMTIALLCLALEPAPAAADGDGDANNNEGLTTTFKIDDQDPEAHVPDAKAAIAAPLQMGYWVMLVAERAEAATKRDDHAAAARYYRAIAKAVPDRSVGFTRACASLEAMGDFAQAAELCRQALDKDGATQRDYANYVRVTLAAPAPSAEAIAELDTALGHLETQLAGTDMKKTEADVVLAQLRCQIGARLGDATRLEACTKTLQALAPNEATTLTFRFAYALATQRYDDAQALLDVAPAAGMTESGVAMMRQRLLSERGPEPTWTHYAAPAAGVALAVAVVWLLLRMRRRTGAVAHG